MRAAAPRTGMTLDRCELALKNVFECGQMYVALSRVRSLEGLALRNIDWSKCRAHPKVLAWHRETVQRDADATSSAVDQHPVASAVGI